jgi:predicted metalloprotease with PDZ domain
MWDSPAFNAGLEIGTEIVAINSVSYSDDGIKQEIADAKGTKAPIRLLIKNGERFREVAIDYHGGLRYPRLEKTVAGEGGLDRLLTAKP